MFCYYCPLDNISMGESNTVVSAYTLYRHLQQSCSRPSIYACLIILNVRVFSALMTVVVVVVVSKNTKLTNAQMTFFFFLERIQYICGKRRKCCLPAF